MDNTVINIALLVTYIVFGTLISIALSKYSYMIQSIMIIFLFIAAIVTDRLLIYFFRDYFVTQWYYSSSNSWKTGYGESIVAPFICIAGIIYTVIQVIIFKMKSMKRK